MRFAVIICLICSFSVLDISINATELYRADGKIMQGKLTQIDQNQFTLQTDMGKRTVPAAEIIRVDLEKPVLVNPRQGLVVLANDDRIHAELLRSEDDFVFVKLGSCPETGELKIPLETMQAACFRWPKTQQLRTEFLQKITQMDQETDLFFLNNGDNLEGEFLGFDAGTFRFESRAGETSVPRKGIQFFTINPELINFPQPVHLRYRLTLTNGSRVTVSSLALDQNELTAQTLFGGELRCNVGRVVSITPLGGRGVPLSEIKPAKYQFTPYFSQTWSWQRNRNVLRGPLRVGGREFTSGLGMHSAAELHYQLNGKYAAFETEVGIDDSTLGKGDAKVVVLVDQRIMFQGAIQGISPQSIIVPRIDLSSAQELVLKVEFGKNGDIQDHVNWCCPVLILQK